jgi:hypothetical protein
MVEMKTRLTMANRSYYGHLNPKTIPRSTKVTIFKTLIRPVLVYGAEAWVLTKQDKMQLGCFERKILCKLYGLSNSRGVWRRRTNSELYQLYHDDDIVKFVKLCRLQMSENDPAKKGLMLEPGGRRPTGRPKLRWEKQIEEETARVGCRGQKVIAAI